MKTHTAYMSFETDERREFVRITEEVQAAVSEAGISDGMALVSAMHITAGVWVNDDEPGIQADALEWLDKLAPPSWREKLIIPAPCPSSSGRPGSGRASGAGPSPSGRNTPSSSRARRPTS